MSTSEALGWIVFGLFLLIAIVSTVCTHEARKERRRKQNIRVPRETLWARTHRHHTKGN